MGGWRLTVRRGSTVERERYSTLDEAVAELERRAEEVRAGGGLGEAKVFRTYEPGQRVEARLELTGPGALRRPGAGIDVMGNGEVVPYRGAILKQRLEPAPGQGPYAAVREALGVPG